MVDLKQMIDVQSLEAGWWKHFQDWSVWCWFLQCTLENLVSDKVRVVKSLVEFAFEEKLKTSMMNLRIPRKVEEALLFWLLCIFKLCVLG